MPVYSPDDEKVMSELIGTTSFSADEMRNMQASFKKIAASGKDDGLIDFAEFKAYLGNADALFRVFDADEDGFIDFKEYVLALALYQNKSKTGADAAHLKGLFASYDVDGDGIISRGDLVQVLQRTIQKNNFALEESVLVALADAALAKFQAKADINEFARVFKNRPIPGI
eukprot:TRINITY_DN4139_c3_g1_i1.p2 TRINITY_DN4139_c3_g1~~TRINITY_DN4139_c3_g1_i1.p2  ORF type:complete len:171 (+),score=79.87 TRINITY_DN4139_c3_g1_i1:67-579(+)